MYISGAIPTTINIQKVALKRTRLNLPNFRICFSKFPNFIVNFNHHMKSCNGEKASQSYIWERKLLLTAETFECGKFKLQRFLSLKVEKDGNHFKKLHLRALTFRQQKLLRCTPHNAHCTLNTAHCAQPIMR